MNYELFHVCVVMWIISCLYRHLKLTMSIRMKFLS